MPLTPAEVHNVAFKKPPIGKRGYDEEEVDAFLDIVEVELSRLIEENNDLRSHGSGGGATPDQAAERAELDKSREENRRLQQRISELENAAKASGDGAAQQPSQQTAQLQQQLAQSEAQVKEHRAQVEQAQRELAQTRQQLQTAQAQARQAPSAGDQKQPANAEHHQQAVQMLALAQQTADQHLAQSKAEAERLVAEAQAHAHTTRKDTNDKTTAQLADADARAKKLHEDSTARAQQTISDAEQRAATITAQFEQRKGALENRVEELRTFEREYRTRLKSYLESQLRDLDASGRAEPTSPNGDFAQVHQPR